MPQFNGLHARCSADRIAIVRRPTSVALVALLLSALLIPEASATLTDEDFKNVEVVAAVGQVALTSMCVYQRTTGDSGRFPGLLSMALGIASISIAATDDAHYRTMDIIVGTASLGIGIWALVNEPGRSNVRTDLEFLPSSSQTGAYWSPAIVLTFRY
jgi:hypothetical protein